MRIFKYISVAIAMLCLMAGMAQAGVVNISLVMEDDEMSPMALREKAMAKGFATVILQEAQVMLPTELAPARAELFKEYLTTHGKPYIQGYKILSSQVSDEGVKLSLDVQVNKKTLREKLKTHGFFATSVNPQVAVVDYPEDMDEETKAELHGLMTLTGIQPGQDVFPVFTLLPGPEGTYKMRLEGEKQEWMSVQKDMSAAWFNVWRKFFARNAATASKSGTRTLDVSGWFSPDAVLEFDRVLQGWESAVQDVKLIEMDMQAAGVGGTWEFRMLNSDRLAELLQSYLPQRGLTYQLSDDPAVPEAAVVDETTTEVPEGGSQ